jgi:hypothetical protein
MPLILQGSSTTIRSHLKIQVGRNEDLNLNQSREGVSECGGDNIEHWVFVD